MNSLDTLISAGVRIPAPDSVFIEPCIGVDQIAPGTVIHPGCRLRGASTVIGPDCELGREGPLTLEDCQLGAGVALAGGYCAGATFLAGASLGADAHVRPGTLMEEQASGGHAVGLKQTLLLPFVTTGSLVNFCDCLMAGGTGRDRHSEVGSSYVHFNFTPQQDKATASLIGDVPQGVMLDQPPIFLGGQGGLVGPARVTYGVVVAAGTVLRGDALEPGHICFGQRRDGQRPYVAGLYVQARRVVRNNLLYLGNLHALRQWYRHVRTRTAAPAEQACVAGAQVRLDQGIRERLKRLEDLVTRLRESVRLGTGLAALPPTLAEDLRFQAEFSAAWPTRRDGLLTPPVERAGADARTEFLAALPLPSPERTHLQTIQALPPDAKALGTRWLQAVVEAVAGETVMVNG